MRSIESTRYLARWAGLLYGATSSVAPFAYLYVPDRLIVNGDALATVDRIRASEALLRSSVYAELSGVTILVFSALLLFELFEQVDRRTARVMAALMLVSVPISYVNTLFHFAPIVLIKSQSIASALDTKEIAGLVTLFMRLHNQGLVVNQIFWGLWLIPIGLLVRRSGYFPRWLAWPLFAAGTGYVLNSLGGIVLPASLQWLTSSLQILGVGEVPFFAFYLLIWGVRGERTDRITAGLVIVLFALGMAGLILLFTRRIDATQYALILGVKTLLAVALVLRWRALRDAGRGAADREARGTQVPA